MSHTFFAYVINNKYTEIISKMQLKTKYKIKEIFFQTLAFKARIVLLLYVLRFIYMIKLTKCQGYVLAPHLSKVMRSSSLFLKL